MSETYKLLLSIGSALALALMLLGMWGMADGVQTHRFLEIALSAVMVLVSAWAAWRAEQSTWS